MMTVKSTSEIFYFQIWHIKCTYLWSPQCTGQIVNKAVRSYTLINAFTVSSKIKRGTEILKWNKKNKLAGFCRNWTEVARYPT